METGHSVCTSNDSCGKPKMVALTRGEQERFLTQERKGVGLPYQHLQPLAWLVEGLQAVKVGVLVDDELESHVCPNPRLVHLLCSLLL